jgi:hypothetical protein
MILNMLRKSVLTLIMFAFFPVVLYANTHFVTNLFIKGNFAYVTGGWCDTFEVYDISSNPIAKIAGRCLPPNNPRAIKVVGDYAYIAENMMIWSISNPYNPILAGQVVLGDLRNKATGIDVNGSYAYVVSFDAGYEFCIFNIANPNSPSLVSLLTIDSLLCIKVVDNYAYVGGETSLKVIDISNKSNPVIVGSVGIGSTGYANHLDVVGNKAYVALSAGGLKIFDISTPTNPILVSSIAKSSAETSDVKVHGNLAYVLDNDPGLIRIFDISNVNNPILLYSNNLGFQYSSALEVTDNKIYVTCVYDLLKVYDIPALVLSSPTLTTTPSATSTATSSATGTATKTQSATSSATATNTATSSPTATTTSSATASSSATSSATGTATKTPSATSSATATNTATSSPTATTTSSATASSSATSSATATASAVTTNTASATGTLTSAASHSAVSSVTATSSASISSSSTPTLAPTLSDFTKRGYVNTSIVFTSTDFVNNFRGGRNLSMIKITSLPSHGTLSLSGGVVTEGQIISAADLINLGYSPYAGFVGTDNFSWKGSDGTRYSINSATVAINILEPALTSFHKSGFINAVTAFTDNDFVRNFQGYEGLDKIKILSLPSCNNGVLKLSGIPVELNKEIPVSSLGSLTFTPLANWNGSTSFSWSGSDGYTYTRPANVSIAISGSNPLITCNQETTLASWIVPTVAGVGGALLTGTVSYLFYYNKIKHLGSVSFNSPSGMISTVSNPIASPAILSDPVSYVQQPAPSAPKKNEFYPAGLTLRTV